jgi:hypothetical protein
MLSELHQITSQLLFRPADADASRRSAHLDPQSGTKSANEVAQIINQKNNSLKEESGSRRIQQNAKSH